MKRVLFLALVMILLLANAVFAGTVTLQWDPVTDPALVGYNIYYGSASKTYTAHVDAGTATTKTITLGAGTWYFAATAYGALPSSESDFSNEVSATIKLQTPKNIRVTGVTLTMTFSPGTAVAIK